MYFIPNEFPRDVQGKQEHEQVQRLRKKLGKEVLMSVVSESKPTVSDD
jgi:hypothetical protein